ncbi:hypothetical protein H6G33_09270 [Calothrix sp. FACHB-1219]|uniref:hypothetical protein n=1 Tax=unclassified Calothrix TaxID=2619626 RepID=UPI0016846E1A|nr:MULTISPECIES: hypothetical protein [unclassified Calothrix]MBD2201535.1 hypothetical protein [Calothrix sp. FACHB-168]MBD2217221.1 hypothetical protein [Calothrix sp. FACHB-1219]
MNIHLERIKELNKPSGSSIYGTDISLDFIKGAAYSYSGSIQLKVNGISLNSDSVFEGGCFLGDCFEGGGIWTTAVKSSITRTVSNVTQYWIEGTTDSLGNVWLCDIGVICPDFSEFYFIDKNLPISSLGIVNTISKIPSGLKIAQLKRVTSSSAETIAYLYGKYLNNDPLIRTTFNSTLEYSYEDQVTNIEDIALGIISLIFNTFIDVKPNSNIYYLAGYIESYITSLVESNFSRLSRLIDTTSSNKRYGSIPYKPATFTEPELLYGDKSDNLFANPEVRVFEEDCFEEGCFKVDTSKLLHSREVSTRAIAWLIISLILYTEYWQSKKFNNLLSSLITYLINQISPSNNLVSKGWTHSNKLSDSTSIEEYNLSTSVVSVIALFKIFQYTSDYNYLDKGVDIYNSIINKFYSYRDRTFTDSPQSNHLDTITYGLLFSTVFNLSELVETSISNLEVLLDKDFNLSKEIPLFNNTGGYQYNLDGSIRYETTTGISYTTVSNNNSLLSFINLLSNSINLQTLVNNQIITGSLISKLDNNSYSFSSLFKDNFESFTSLLTNEKYFNTFTSCSFLLTNQLFSNEDVIRLPLISIQSLNFYRNYIYSKLSNLPLDFSWFSKEALSIEGNLGKLLFSVSKALSVSRVSIGANRYAPPAFISIRDLDIKAKELGLYRVRQESYSNFLTFVNTHIQVRAKGISKNNVINYLSRYSIDVKVKETWSDILSFNSFNDKTFSTYLGEGYYSGSQYSTASLVEITIYQPIDSIIRRIVSSILPLGIVIRYVENIIIKSSLSINVKNSCIRIIESDVVEDKLILQEDGDRILTEDGDYLEQEI